MTSGVKIKTTKPSLLKPIPQKFKHLPGEAVTHDCGDRDRIHKNDPGHVVRPLLREFAKRLAANEPPVTRAQAFIRVYFDQRANDPHRFRNLDQEVVDLWKARTILAWARRASPPDGPRYLWFPNGTGWQVELREGAPPPRGERPEALRNLNLGIHVLDWPARMRDMVQSIGVDVPAVLEEINGKLVKEKARQAMLEAAAQSRYKGVS